VFHADRSLWQPHNEHWSTVPILIYRALFSLFGVRTYVPYVLALIVLHLAVAHLLWRLMRAGGVDMVVATALTTVFVLLGAGYENLLWAFQMGFVGSVAFGLLAVVLVNHRARFGPRDLGAWAAGTAALMCSGIGVTMVAVMTVTALLRRGMRDALLTVAVPGLVYAVWLALAGRHGLNSQPRTLADVYAYPDYIWTGLRSAIEQATGFPGAGPVIVLGLAAWLLRRSGLASGPAAPAFAGAIGALLLFSIIAVGRTSLGVQQSEASRYTYIVIALALPAMGLALDALAGGVAVRHGAIGFLLLLVVLHNLGVLRDQAHRQAGQEQALRTTVLAAAQVASGPGVILNSRPDVVYDPDIVVDDLRRMQRQGSLPSPAGITAADRLAAASVLQYGLGSGALPVPGVAARLESVEGATQERTGPGCIRVTPTGDGVAVQVAGGPPMSLTLTSSTGGDVSAYLRIDAPEPVTAPPRTDKVAAGVAVHVNVTAPVDHVLLRIPATGPSELCGLQ